MSRFQHSRAVHSLGSFIQPKRRQGRKKTLQEYVSTGIKNPLIFLLPHFNTRNMAPITRLSVQSHHWPLRTPPPPHSICSSIYGSYDQFYDNDYGHYTASIMRTFAGVKLSLLLWKMCCLACKTPPVCRWSKAFTA